MDKRRVLVSGAGGDAGIGVIRALVRSGLPLHVHASNYDLNGAGLWMAEFGHISENVESDTYLESLVKLLETERVDAYIPTVDSELAKIAANYSWLVQKTSAKILIGQPEKVLLCSDKLLTQNLISESGLLPLSTFTAKTLIQSASGGGIVGSRHGWIRKPRRGRGSREISYLKSLDNFREGQEEENFVYQELAPVESREFTAGVYVGTKGAALVAAFWRELRSGSTSSAEPISGKEWEFLYDDARRLGEHLGLGYWNIQGKADEQRSYIFEINPRFSGTTELVSRFFNAPAIWVSEGLGLNFSPVYKDSRSSGDRYVRYQEFLTVSKSKEVKGP
jgi:carbamoyl-phosphate synthase large subunit